MNRVLQKKILAFSCIIILMSAAITSTIHSQVTNSGIPHVIAFQGIITEKDGSTIPNGSYDLSFSLYDVQLGGSPLWTETHSGFRIENGILSIILGKKSKDNAITVMFDKKLYLDITINSDINLRQRVELGGTAYSIVSEYAAEVDDLSITNEKFADEAVTDEKIQSVSASSLADVDPDPYSVYWTIMGNTIYGPERNYIGTIEAKDFVIKTFSIERMRFGPTGRVTIGTPANTVVFTVIGKTKLQDTFIKGDLGVGVMPGAAKVHINSPDIVPFRVDVDNITRFQVNQNGKVVINSDIEEDGNDEREAYPLFLNSSEQGIGIKVKGSSDNDNNFVSFWNNDGMKGRIEGESYLDYLADPAYIMRDLYIAATVTADIISFADPVEPASAIAFTAEVIYNAVLIALEHANLGVTYESSSGDYAEWLEKEYKNEIIYPGEIVGITNGKISRNTAGVDQLSCISFSPIVLGNKPPAEKSELFEKVAFIGQVPIKVTGKVKRGDYIIPSGLNNGCGIAVAPEMMTIDEYLKVVGRAWAESDNDGIKYINTAIGFDNAELIKIIQLESKKRNDVRAALEQAEMKIREAKARVSEMNIEIEKVLNKSDKKEAGTSSGL